ncbi:MAG: PEP-CTERM sorting domain-containing protein [Rhodanobacter denitrificans]|uniref:PEP-CTERM sorting domain-containing protein n=1 Tax=Rhodanobacter denitrificans TaxID=666685 RepID=A0A2W5K217_9GAMM|nr:MAG: PEP-CTERM sorting domain-containing protein [Rhodanobacter denitrificans]
MTGWVVLGLLTAPLVSAQTATVTFDAGWDGWAGPQGSGGATTIEAEGGNPGAHAHTVFNNFGITFSTDANTAFLGDYGTATSVTLSVDVKVDSITMIGSPVPRTLVLDVRSYSLAQDGYPWTSVWYPLALLESGQDWARYAVTFDPRATALPAGWGGYGAEDPVTFEPRLPDGVTFADVLAQVESLAFTTLEPGMFYGFADFDLRIDNLHVARVADPIFADGFETD